MDYKYSRIHKLVAIILIITMTSSTLPTGFAFASLEKTNSDLSSSVFSGQSSNLLSSTNTLKVPQLDTNSSMTQVVPEYLNEFADWSEITMEPNNEPNQILLDIGKSMSKISNQLSQEPATLAKFLSLSKVQSTVVTTATIENLLIITFTITNNQLPAILPDIDTDATTTETYEAISGFDFSNDPNVIRNVLLTDELLSPQAALIRASSLPDRNGNKLAWNLGDIAPLASITMTMTLKVPPSGIDFYALDSGAQAWGTLQKRAVFASIAPITLAPVGFDEWLVCTIDANCEDQYVVEKAAELGNNPIKIFEYTRSLGYESYQGSLRGARGTLWSKAGNSMDQASLLIALLRASGIPASYRHGTLQTAQAQELILSMFPEPTQVIGHIPAGAEVSDPANEPQLLDETQDHWWVEAYIPGSGWQDLDPSFANAVIGQLKVPDGSVATEYDILAI